MPSPLQVIRSHPAPLHHIAFSADNSLLYSGDEQGNISITDTRARRVVSSWKAHDGEVLALGEWQGGLISQGRDNGIHFHVPLSSTIDSDPSASREGPPPSPSNPAVSELITHLTSNPNPNPNSNSTSTSTLTALLPPPRIKYSFPSNSLNFCKMSILQLPSSFHLRLPSRSTQSNPLHSSDDDAQGLLAVPSLVEAESIDLYHLPSLVRIGRSISDPDTTGSGEIPVIRTPEQREEGRRALVMGCALWMTGSEGDEGDVNGEKNGEEEIEMGIAFEDGRVEVWGITSLSLSSISDSGGLGAWDLKWREKVHNEAIMSMTVSPTKDFLWTVSADHFLIRYRIRSKEGEERVVKFNTKQIGNSDVSVSSDGKVVVVAGWDGKIRLFSTKRGTPLGILDYHRDTCHTVCFPSLPSNEDRERKGTKQVEDEDEDEDEDDLGMGQKAKVGKWLVSGGKDRRVVIWELKDFKRK